MLTKERKALKVVDFGGACGVLYFLAKKFLKDDIEIKWHIVETPMMVRKGKLLESNELSFFNNIKEAVLDFDGIDLALSSSTLSYAPDPLMLRRHS